MLGSILEKAGWRQGSVIRELDLSTIKSLAKIGDADATIVILVSQSCDIANNKIKEEPFVEALVCNIINKLDGNFTNNKNPRKHHTQLLRKTSDSEVLSPLFIESLAFRKIQIPKPFFVNKTPDEDTRIEEEQLNHLKNWLSARYTRPALPTEFNNRVDAIDEKDKRKQKAKKLNKHLSGLYVEIEPDSEIRDDENYSINLLGLLSASFEGDIKEAKSSVEGIAEIFKKAGMEVKSAVLKEDQLSITDFRRFKRLYYDDLSLKEGTVLPPEVPGGV